MYENVMSEGFAPVYIRVIGAGDSTKEIIENVNSYGNDFVSAMVVSDSAECVPFGTEKIVLVVTNDFKDVADKIGRIFHDSGVLTVGVYRTADINCYNSVLSDAVSTDLAEVVETVVKPAVVKGVVGYDFIDLQASFLDSDCFAVVSATGCGDEPVRMAVDSIEAALSPSLTGTMQNLTFFLYFKKDKKLSVKDIAAFNDLVGRLSSDINILFAVFEDEKIMGSDIKLSVLITQRDHNINACPERK